MAITKLSPVYNSFTGGELSPRLDGRTDLKMYNKGCRTLENMFVYSHGGATKRPGTAFVAEAGVSSESVRLIPFSYSSDSAYILELGEKYMRFYTQSGQIYTDSVSGIPVEISTPWDADELKDLKFVQSNDVMYFTHPDYKPRKLIRYSHTDWDIAAVDFLNGPFLDLNTTTCDVSASGTTGTVTIKADNNIFTEDHVGGLFKIQDNLEKSVTITAIDQNSGNVKANAGDVIIWSITGTWDGIVRLQKSYDAGATWLTYATTTENAAISITEVKDGVRYRTGSNSTTWNSGTATARVEKTNYFGYGKIASFVSGKEVTLSVTTTLPHSSEKTQNWAFGAWSDAYGYPSSVAFYEQRLVFAGSIYQPQTLWGSKIGDYENFDSSIITDDAAYIHTIASNDVQTIQWLLAHQDYLIIGTTSGEWRFGFPDSATTQSNVSIKRQTSYGSAFIQALPVAHHVVYMQKGSTKLRMMNYSQEQGVFISPEVSLWSEHLLENGVVDMTYVGRPDTQIFMVDAAGVIVSLTYDPYNETAAFSKYTTTGVFESVASIPGSERDELWCVVQRTINGTDVRYIEQFQTEAITGDDYSTNFFVDCGIEGAFDTPTFTVSGADHLEGETVSVLADGAVQTDKVVSGGTITLDTSASTIIIGIPYTAKLETMKIEVQTKEGTAIGKPVGIFQVALRLYKTVGCKLGYDEEETDVISFRDSSMSMNEMIPLFTGEKTLTFNRGFDKSQVIWLISDDPLPFSVVAIVPTVIVNITGS